MRVTVDQDKCTALAEDTRKAAAACPALAIHLEE